MKVLVTGASGFIGSHVAEQLVDKGYDVYCSMRKTSNPRWLIDKNVIFANVNLFDINDIKKVVKDCEYIYHIAGATFARNESEFMLHNSTVTDNLINATIEAAPKLKKFVYLSSQTVAGPAKSLESPISEDLSPNPLTAYARSKKSAEDIINKRNSDIPTVICRAPAVYGARDTAIFDIFRLIQKGLATYIGFTEKYLNLIEGSDLARGIIMAGESEKTISNTYFITSKKKYTWTEVLPIIAESLNKKKYINLKVPHGIVLSVGTIMEIISKLTSKPQVFNYDKAIDFIQKYWICSHEKALNDFGFEQNIELLEGIYKTTEWYKSIGWLK